MNCHPELDPAAAVAPFRHPLLIYNLTFMPGQKVSNYSVGAWVFPEILQNSAFHFPQVMLGAISKIRSRFKYEFHDYIISMHQTFLLLGGCSLQLAASVVSFNCREPRSETHSLNPPSMIAIPIRKSADKRCSLYIKCVSKVLGQLSDSRISYIASVTIVQRAG